MIILILVGFHPNTQKLLCFCYLNCSKQTNNPHTSYLFKFILQISISIKSISLFPPPTFLFFGSVFDTRLLFLKWLNLLISKMLPELEPICVLYFYPYDITSKFSKWSLPYNLCFWTFLEFKVISIIYALFWYVKVLVKEAHVLYWVIGNNEEYQILH